MPKSARSRTPKVQVLSSRVVYRGPVFRVTRDKVVEPSGVRAERDIVRHTGSVVILAVDDTVGEPRLLLEQQYRYAAEDLLWELPAGRIDEGESYLAAAKRELLEETGFTARRWKRALEYYASPGFVDETMTLYLAQDLRPGTAQPEDDEVILTRFFSLLDAEHMISSGMIRDGKTLIGVLWYVRNARRLSRKR